MLRISKALSEMSIDYQEGEANEHTPLVLTRQLTVDMYEEKETGTCASFCREACAVM